MSKEKTSPIIPMSFSSSEPPEAPKAFVKAFKDGKDCASSERAPRFWLVEQDFGYVLGRVLTIVDASLQDKEQNKAVKDIIKSEFYRAFDVLRIDCWPKGLMPQVRYPEQGIKDE